MARSKRVIEAEAKAEKRGMEEKRKALAKLLAMEDKLNVSDVTFHGSRTMIHLSKVKRI